MSQIEVNKLGLNIGEKRILKEVSFNVEQGERVCVLGHTGSGKSTLLSVLSGIRKAITGEVLIDGKNVADMPPRQRGISLLPQDGMPYDNFTGMQVLRELGCDLTDNQKMLEAFLVDDLIGSKFSQLSGGQKRRLELVTALMRENKIVLLDEPFSSTDAPIKEKLLLPLKKYSEESGSTLIVVTHDQREAFKLGSKLIILKDGMVEQIGTPSEIYNDPDTIFVAGFIGLPTMNFVNQESEVLGIRPNEWSLKPVGGGLTLPVNEVDRVDLGDRVEVYYTQPEDPEKIQVASFAEELPERVTQFNTPPLTLVKRFDPKSGERRRY